MIALIIVLIFSMAFIGFHINGFSSNFITNKPENNKHFDLMKLQDQHRLRNQLACSK